jgi:tryptophan halogenase
VIKRVLVVGGGTAGCLAAINIKHKAPRLEVTMLRSVTLGVIGVGEGTTPVVPNYLHADLAIPPAHFLRTARPTIKLGALFFWGPRPWFTYPFRAQFSGRYVGLAHDNGFYCWDNMDDATVDSSLMMYNNVFERQQNGLPAVRNNFGYHIENVRFVSFLEDHARKLGVILVDDKIERVEQNESGVTGVFVPSGKKYDADLYVDCSGFVSLLLGKTLGQKFRSFDKTLFCDRAVIGGWERALNEPVQPYTFNETMNAGWCWRIDHDDRINRGYVYSSAFIKDDEAEKEFRAKNPRVTATSLVKMVSGYYENGWVKNVVGVGNAAGFVEPLEATSIAIIARQACSLGKTLADENEPLPDALKFSYNRWQQHRWNLIKNFLAIHYRFNTMLDTPFWKACRADVELGDAKAFTDFYQECGPHAYWTRSYIDGLQIYETEGFLTLMIGMKVPYKTRYPLPEKDLQMWSQHRQSNRGRAALGINIPDALKLMAAPDAAWPDNFFQPID